MKKTVIFKIMNLIPFLWIFSIYEVEAVDFDGWMGDEAACVEYILCELKQSLEFKKGVDALHDKEVEHFFFEVLRPYTPENLKEMLTLENIRKDEMWIDLFQPEACKITDDVKKKKGVEKDFTAIFGARCAETCHNPETAEQCESLEKATTIFQEMLATKIASGECDVLYAEKGEGAPLQEKAGLPLG